MIKVMIWAWILVLILLSLPAIVIERNEQFRQDRDAVKQKMKAQQCRKF